MDKVEIADVLRGLSWFADGHMLGERQRAELRDLKHRASKIIRELQADGQDHSGVKETIG